MWSVQQAKARLSELMRRARGGEPQVIGVRDPCILMSADGFRTAVPEKHLGRFLVETAPRGDPLELPQRDPDRGDVFSNS